MVFSAQNTSIPEGKVSEINSILYKFLLPNKERLKRKTLILPLEEVGLNMVDIESFFNSLQARWINRIVESNENWAYNGNKLIDNYAPHKLLLKTSELKNDYIQTFPDCYRQIVYSFIQIRSLTVQQPATSDDIANKPLWHNKFITTKIRKRACKLYLSNWIKSSILYVKDLQFTNGKVDKTFIFEVVKQKSNLLIETLKVKTALNSSTNILQ